MFTPSPPIISYGFGVCFAETAAGCTATQTLDMFLNEITSSGTIGQVSATVCSGETPPALPTMPLLQD